MDELTRRSASGLAHGIQVQRTHLAGIQHNLASLNPLAVLSRGYAILSLPDGTQLSSIDQAKPGAAFDARLQDGSFEAQVQRIKP